MEIQYFGANCLRLVTKKARIVVDDNLEELGLKSITGSGDINLKTNLRIPDHGAKFVADMPGEYEISGIIIHGIASRAHMEEEGKTNSVIYTVSADNIKVAILGHIYPDLSDDQLEEIGLVDIAVVPVGNSGYTLDGVGALKLIKKIAPKVIIPVHYADKAVRYKVPQQELAEALKSLGMEPSEKAAKYKFKPNELTDATHLVVLERQ